MSNDQLHQNPGSRANPGIELSVSYVEAPIVGNQSILISGRIGFGEEVIITSPDGSLPLAEMGEGPAAHYQDGGRIVMNGVEFHESVGGDWNPDVWGGMSGDAIGQPLEITAERARYPGHQVYLAKHKGSFTSPKAFAPHADKLHRTLYGTRWSYINSPYARTYCFPAAGAGQAGFLTSSDWSPGEDIVISTVGGHTYNAQVIAAIGDTITWYLRDLQGYGGPGRGVKSMYGATVTGIVSGATTTIGSAPDGMSMLAIKEWRNYDGGNAGQRTSVVMSASNGGMIDVDFYGSNGAPLGSDFDKTDPRGTAWDLHGASSAYSTAGEWVRCEFEIDFTGPLGRVSVRHNNGAIHSRDDLPIDYLSPIAGFSITNIGLDTPGVGGVNTNEIGVLQYFDIQHMDNSLYRWVVGDAATLDDCTAFEVQEIVDRNPAAKQHKIRLHPGALSTLTGRHLILVGPGFSTVASIQL